MSEPATENEITCPECEAVGEHRTFQMAAHLASHRKHKHGIEPEGRSERPAAPRRGGGLSPNTLEGRIKDACLGTAAVVAISDPRIYIAVEGTVDQFARAWANVAKASPTAKRYIEALLTGGVWIPAVMSSVVMMVAVMMATDRLPANMSGLGYYVLNQMDQESIAKLQAMAQTAPPASNGTDPLGAQE